jgi:hypothetical protein
MKAIDKTPFDEMLLLVGRLNYSWTNTESLLIHLIAGLARTDKESAVVIFLTLNTTRARIDLVERLSKLERTPKDEKTSTLALTARVLRHSGLRNRLNHSIYAFDSASGTARTIMMRIADRKDNIKMGKSADIDDTALREIEIALADMGELNKEFWDHISKFNYPT